MATEQNTRATNLPKGAERSSILIRGMCAPNSRISKEAKGSPRKTAGSVRRTSPPKPTTGFGNERVRSRQAWMREILLPSTGVRLLNAPRSFSVKSSGIREIKSAFLLALPLAHLRVQSNAVRNSCHHWERAFVVVPYVSDTLQCFMVRCFAKFHAPYFTSDFCDGTDNAGSFQVQRGPLLLEIEGSPADIITGQYRAVRSFLFERGTKPADEGVAVYMEGAGAVGYSVRVQEDQNWWSIELGKDLASDNIDGRQRDVLHILPEKGGKKVDLFRQVGLSRLIVFYATHQRTDLVEVLGHGHSHQRRTFCALGRIPAGEMEWPETIASLVLRRVFEGGSLRLCMQRRSNRARIVVKWAVGSKS